MPRHLKPKQKWELFLKTISNRDIIVTQVTDTEIGFRVNSEKDLQHIRDLLGNPGILKSQVTHPLQHLVGNGLLVQDRSDESSSSRQLILEYDNPKSLLYTLVEKAFLDDIGLKEETLDQFVDNPSLKIATLQLKGSLAQIKRDTAEFEMLQTAFNESKHLSEVLHGHTPKLKKYNEDSSDFAKDVITIKIAENGKQAEVKFNYGKILQDAQAGDPASTAPVIVASSIDAVYEYTFNKNYLLKYLQQHLGGIVFHSEDSTQTPIIFSPQHDLPDAANATHHFEILMDVSGSMSAYLDTYKARFKEIIVKISEKVEHWRITLTTFNDKINSREFSSTDQEAIENIISHIEGLKAGGDTNLHGAMDLALRKLSESFSADHHSPSTLIIFTDGTDNVKQLGKGGEEYIADKARATSNDNPQFSMYCLGLKEQKNNEYNKEFFLKIGTKAGFTTIDLANIDEMRTFEQYIDTINNLRQVWEFITNDVATHVEHVPTGDVFVSSALVTGDQQVRQGGITFQMGREELQPQLHVEEEKKDEREAEIEDVSQRQDEQDLEEDNNTGLVHSEDLSVAASEAHNNEVITPTIPAVDPLVGINNYDLNLLGDEGNSFGNWWCVVQ